MPAQATYQRRDTQAGIQWDIKPASASKGFLMLYAPLSVIAAVIAATIGAAIGDFFGGVIGLGIAAAFLWIRIWKSYVGSLAHREPISLVVDKTSVRAGTKSFARNDIAELGIFPGYEGPNAQPAATTSVLVSDSPMAMAAHGAQQIASSVVLGTTKALRENIFSGQAARSMLVKLRLKQGPQWHVLAGGLSPDVAQALMTDLATELQRPST